MGEGAQLPLWCGPRHFQIAERKERAWRSRKVRAGERCGFEIVGGGEKVLRLIIEGCGNVPDQQSTIEAKMSQISRKMLAR